MKPVRKVRSGFMFLREFSIVEDRLQRGGVEAINEPNVVKAFAAGANAFPIRLSAFETQGHYISELYCLFATTCGAGLLISNCALTLCKPAVSVSI